MLNFADITEELCIHCGECCKLYIPVTGNERYINFIKGIGISYVQDDAKTLRIFLGYCPNLNLHETEGINQYFCSIYPNRPELCKDFNCIAWAKVSNSYDKSEFVKRASETFEILQLRKVNESQ